MTTVMRIMGKQANRLIRAAVTVTAALALSACATGAQPAAPAPPTDSEPILTSSRAVPPAGIVPACRNDDMTATVTLQPNRADELQRGLASLTNRSESACRIQGHASVTLVNAADEVLAVPTKMVDQPGAPMPVTLGPGGTAFQGIKWVACDKAEAACRVGNTLRLSLESQSDGLNATLDGFPAPESNSITMMSVEVGTLQPSRKDVVAW
jgi:hypothetical protein